MAAAAVTTSAEDAKPVVERMSKAFGLLSGRLSNSLTALSSLSPPSMQSIDEKESSDDKVRADVALGGRSNLEA